MRKRGVFLSVFIKYLFLTSLACVLVALFPGFTIITAIFWGVSIFFAGVHLKHSQLLPLLAANILLLYAIAGSSAFFQYLTVFGLALLVIGFLAASRKNYYDTMKWSLAAAILGTSFFLGVSFYSGALETEALYREYEVLVGESMQWYEEAGFMETWEAQGLSREELRENMLELAYTLSRHLPGLLYLEAIFLVFATMHIASWQAKRRKIFFLLKKPYIFEIMPWQFAWFVILALGLFLLGPEKQEILHYWGSNMLLISIPVLMYFGISALVFRIKPLEKNVKIVIGIFMVLLALGFPASILVIVCAIALFDSLLDYRKLRIYKGD